MSTPRLLIDVTRTLESGLHTGIQRVVRGLYRGARAGAGTGAAKAPVTVHPVRFAGNGWLDLGELAPHPLEARPAAVTELAPPVRLQPQAGDLLLLADASWYTDPWPAVDALLAAGGRVAGFVHDLLPLQHPDWFRPGVGTAFTAHLHALMERASTLYVSTTYVAAQLAPLLPCPLPLRVLPLASSLGHASTQAMPDRKPYYLAVATLEPRKNHALMLDAFDELWAEDQGLQLQLVGAPGWRCEALHARVRSHPCYGRQLHWLRDVDDARLRALYRGAQALLYLSRDEGFGLPVLEARALGCPVIASDIPPLREAGGDWPRYIPANNVAALRQALLAPPGRPQGIPGAERSWRDTAEPLLALCQSPAGQPVVAYTGDSAAVKVAARQLQITRERRG